MEKGLQRCEIFGLEKRQVRDDRIEVYNIKYGVEKVGREKYLSSHPSRH